MSADREGKDRKWEQVQIKAFKAWVNGALSKRGIDPIEDIEKDLQDGTKLLQFLEIVTNKKVPRYDKKPMQKIQKIQNLSIALTFVKDELAVNLVTIGAEDLYDGNLKLILGMLWTLFRKLRIANITEEGRSSEDGLLLWVKKMTADYPGVNINSFKDSFSDGLAFSALIHKFNHDLINFDAVRAGTPEANLENAFEIAEKALGIPKLLEASDLLSGSPDERSVILYVSLYFHAFVSNEERKRLEASKTEITDKMTTLETQLSELENENEELIRTKEKLEHQLSEKERERLEREKALNEQLEEKLHLLEEKEKQLQLAMEERDRRFAEDEQKALLLQSQIDYLKQRCEKDAEAMQLLNEKIQILEQLLEAEGHQKSSLDGHAIKLKADLEDLEARSKLLATEKSGLEDLKKRLISENEKKEASISELEARKGSLLKEIEDLKNRVSNEIERRTAAAKQILQLKKDLEDLKRKQIVQGKARGGLDILRINLEEHLEDMYRWRELHELVLEDDKRVFDLDQVLSDIKDKSFHQQLEYLNEHLQAENASLLRIIRLKDSKFKLKDVEVKSGWLFMKGRKDWKRRWFSLRGQSLYYYETEESERCEGFVDLTKGCEVVRQKAVKEDDSTKKQWPLKITVGDRKLFVRAASKKERHSWYLFLASKIAHINYLKAVETTGNRPDTRIITVFASENIPNLLLDHRPIPEEAAIALSKTLPAHDETETLSLSQVGLNDTAVNHLSEVLEKLNIKSLIFSGNKITSEGAASLAKGLVENTTITEINLADNMIDDVGVQALAQQIAAKPSITSLDFSGNKLTAAGLKPLVDAILNANLNLPELRLSRTGIDDHSIAEVARLLEASKNITSVKLDGNEIGDAGAEILAQALNVNRSVLSLDLSNNKIGNKGALAIENALKNPTINSVNLSENKGITGGPSLAPLLKEGFSFSKLSLDRLHPTNA